MGVIPVQVPHVKREVRPIDDFQARMTIEAYSKVSIGVSICVIAFAVSLLWTSRVTNTVCSVAMAGGGVWALIGFIKLFVATHIVLLCWVAFIGVAFAIIYRLRKRSINRSFRWLKSLIKTPR